jgi:hypothetical protein
MALSALPPFYVIDFIDRFKHGDMPEDEFQAKGVVQAAIPVAQP